MINAQVNMARIVATQTAFTLESDGFLIGYNEDDGRLLIQSGPMVLSARPEDAELIQNPPHLAVMAGGATAIVDLNYRLYESLLKLYGGACQ